MNARKSILGLIFAFVLLAASNLACGLPFLQSPTATPTETLIPTSTTTLTPLPTSTNTPKPTATATPNLKATLAAQQEQEVKSWLAKYELSTDTGSLGWHQDKKISIKMTGPTHNKYATFAEDLEVSDFVLYTEMTWDTNGWPVCGAWVRADTQWQKGDRYVYQFLRFSGLPAWDIEYFRGGRFVSNVTEQIRFSNYLSIADGATNKVALAANESEFQVYINDNFVGRYYDYSSQIEKGYLAFFGDQDSGETTCTFQNSWLWIYK